MYWVLYKISRRKKKRKIKNKLRSGVPPGESPGEKGQQGHLIVFEKGQKGPRKGLYQNGQYVGVQAHMLTRLKTHVYLFIHVQYSPIYISIFINITLYNQICIYIIPSI